MSTRADDDIAISAAAVRTILDLPTAEILRLVVGLGEGEAQNLASSSGLVVTITYQDVAAGDTGDGRVISQSVAAGTRVVSQTPITLVVGRVPTSG